MSEKDIKVVSVVIDDFTSKSLYEFSDYNVTYYDYGVSYTQYGIDEFWFDGFSNYDLGDVDYAGDLGDFSFGWSNLDNLNSLSYSFSTDPIAQEYFDPDFYYFDRYYTYSYFDAIDPVTSWNSVDTGHGDWTLKAFTDQLTNPEDVEIIAIDFDFSAAESSSLFEAISVNGKNLPNLYSIISDAFDDLYDPNYDYILTGISCSFTDSFPDAVNAELIQNLISEDWFVVQSAPNVTSSGFDWGEFVPNVINVAAWNTDQDLYALAASSSSLDTVDVFANGYVERIGWESGLGSGWNFGTSFATPRVFADITNLFTDEIAPAIESGEINFDPTISLNSSQETQVISDVLNHISEPYTVFLDDDVVKTGTVSVAKSTIELNGVTPVAIPTSLPSFGYKVTGVNQEVITEQALVTPQLWNTLEFSQAEVTDGLIEGNEFIAIYDNGFESHFGFDRDLSSSFSGNLIYLDVYDTSGIKVFTVDGFSFNISTSSDFDLVADRIAQLDVKQVLTSGDDWYEFDPDGSAKSEFDDYLSRGITPGNTISIDGGDGVDTLFSSFWSSNDYEFSINESDNIVAKFLPTGTSTEITNFEKFQLADTQEISFSNLYQWVSDPDNNPLGLNDPIPSGKFSAFKNHVLSIFDDNNSAASSSASNTALSMQLADTNGFDNDQAYTSTII